MQPFVPGDGIDCTIKTTSGSTALTTTIKGNKEIKIQSTQRKKKSYKDY
jgi:hypothetical protein